MSNYKIFTTIVGACASICASVQAEDTWCCPAEVSWNPRTIASTAVQVPLHLFSKETALVAACIAPLYALARTHDDSLHRKFYCAQHHRHKKQMPSWCSHAAQDGILAVIGLVAAANVFSSDECARTTGMVYLIGLPIVWGFKNIGKRMEHCGCVRPKNEHFCKDKTYYGGCPSGHGTYALFTTTLMWKQHGWRWGLPLAAFSAFVFADSVNCNRHYASQMVAGAGLGIALGLAASAVVDRLRWDNVCCSVGVEPVTGAYNLQVSYQF